MSTSFDPTTKLQIYSSTMSRQSTVILSNITKLRRRHDSHGMVAWFISYTRAWPVALGPRTA